MNFWPKRKKSASECWRDKLKITGFHIDRYGLFENFKVEKLSANVTVFLGDNEAGKSTLLSFFRYVLFGFDLGRGKSAPYPPLAGGERSGRITVADADGARFTISRKGDKGEAVVTGEGGAPAAAGTLSRLLAGVSGPIYRNVFAVSLDELQDYHSLDDNSLAASIFGAGAGAPAASLPKALRDITSAHSALYTKKSRGRPIDDRLKEFDGISSELKSALDETAKYDELVLRLDGLKSEANEAAVELDRLKASRDKTRRYRDIWPSWIEHAAARKELEALPKRDDELPADIANRYRENLDIRESAIGEAKRETEQCELLSAECDALVIDEKIIAAEREIEKLKSDRHLFAASRLKVPELSAKLKSIDGRLSDLCAALGPEWSPEKAEAVSRSLLNRRQLDELGDKIELLVAEVIKQDDRLKVRVDSRKQLEEKLEAEIETLAGIAADENYDEEVARKIENDRRYFAEAIKDIGRVADEERAAAAALDREIKSINPKWSDREIIEFDTGLAAVDEAKQKVRLIETAAGELSESKIVLKNGAASVEELERKLKIEQERLDGLDAPTTESRAEAEAKRGDIRELKSAKSRLQSFRQEHQAAADQIRFARQYGGAAPGGLSGGGLSSIILAIFGALALAAGAFLNYGPLAAPVAGAFAVGASLAAISIIISAVLFFIKSGRGAAASAAGAAPVDGRRIRELIDRREQLEVEIEQHAQKVNDLAAHLGVSDLIGESELARMEDRIADDLILLAEKKSQQERVGAMQKELEAKRDQFSARRREAERAEENNRQANDGWEEFLGARGLSSKIDPGSISAVFQKVESLRSRLSDIGELRSRIGRMEETRDEYIRLSEKIPALVEAARSGDPFSLLTEVDRFLQRRKDAEALLAEKRAKTRIIDSLKKDIKRTLEEEGDAEKELAEIKEKLGAEQSIWRAKLEEIGLPDSLPPKLAASAFASIDRIIDQLGESKNIAEETERLKAEANDFISRLTKVLTELGREAPDPEDAEAEMELLERELKENNARALKREEKQANIDGVKKLIEIEQAKVSQALAVINELVELGGVKNEAELTELLERDRRKRELEQLVADGGLRIAQDLGEAEQDKLIEELSGLTQEMIDQKIYEADREIERLEEERSTALTQVGELTEQIKRLQSEEETSRLRARRESLRAELGELAEEWAKYRLAEYLLDSARKKYEREKQPVVLKRAEEIFEKLTEGRYSKLHKPLAEGVDTIEVINPERPDERKNYFELSRGAREQLYLSVRFGYIISHSEQNGPIPLIMDDLMVNFDPDRRQAASQAISEIASKCQVIYFTCHPEAAEALCSASADSARFQIESGKLS